jgi:glycosyltransferase involved in cell wall biosynthesis
MMENKVSVVIHTLNEDKNIRYCLESVKWADEIILVDMYSEDKTVDIAREYTDKIFFFESVGYADPARKFSLEKTTNQWILSIDADELVPKIFKDRLFQIMEDDLADVVYTPHNNYFFGDLMKGTGWGPVQDYHPRFFKKNFLNYSDKIHSFTSIKDTARLYTIENPDEGFIHFNYIDVEQFIEKLNRYTTIEAKNLFLTGEDTNKKGLIKIMWDEFYGRYYKKKGYKEGFQGLSLSLLMAMYRLATYSKLKLMMKYNTNNPHEKIAEEYQKLADKILDQYNE